MREVEIWKPVPDFEDLYEVSSRGRIKSLRKKKLLTLRVDHHGYPVVDLYFEGCYRLRVHRLVMLAFEGIPPRGLEVRHLNDVKIDNRLENLRYGTRRQNMLDGYKNGRMKSGFPKGYVPPHAFKKGHKPSHPFKKGNIPWNAR